MVAAASQVRIALLMNYLRLYWQVCCRIRACEPFFGIVSGLGSQAWFENPIKLRVQPAKAHYAGFLQLSCKKKRRLLRLNCNQGYELQCILQKDKTGCLGVEVFEGRWSQSTAGRREPLHNFPKDVRVQSWDRRNWRAHSAWRSPRASWSASSSIQEANE